MNNTLMLIAAAVAALIAYFGIYPVLDKKYGLSLPKVVAIEEPEEVVAAAPKPKPRLKIEPKAAPEPEVAMVEPTAPVIPMEEPEPEPEEGGFVPPEFLPLDVVVGNWQQIPEKAFPREVTLGGDVEFKMAVGSSKARAGGRAFAVAMEGDIVQLAPTQTSLARAALPIDQTDLKQVLTDFYEKWKVMMTKRAKMSYDRRQLMAQRAAGQETTAAMIEGAGAKPEVGPDGSIEIMLASMRKGQVTEIRPSNIDAWGPLIFEEIDGTEYWTATVNYTTQTIFGPFPAEAQALMRQGAVEKWIYTGTGEVVP